MRSQGPYSLETHKRQTVRHFPHKCSESSDRVSCQTPPCINYVGKNANIQGFLLSKSSRIKLVPRLLLRSTCEQLLIYNEKLCEATKGRKTDLDVTDTRPAPDKPTPL